MGMFEQGHSIREPRMRNGRETGTARTSGDRKPGLNNMRPRYEVSVKYGGNLWNAVKQGRVPSYSF